MDPLEFAEDEDDLFIDDTGALAADGDDELDEDDDDLDTDDDLLDEDLVGMDEDE